MEEVSTSRKGTRGRKTVRGVVGLQLAKSRSVHVQIQQLESHCHVNCDPLLRINEMFENWHLPASVLLIQKRPRKRRTDPTVLWLHSQR